MLNNYGLRPVYTENDIRQYMQAFKRNPRYFNPDQIKTLQKYADYYKIPYNKDEFDFSFSILDGIKQLGEGFLSGFTTIQIGKPSNNVYENIFRAIGQAAGFMGYIPATPVSWTAKGIGLAAEKAGLGIAAKGLKQISTKAGARAFTSGIKSVPVFVADKATKYAGKWASAAVAKAAQQGSGRALGSVTNFLMNKSTQHILHGAFRFGVASSTASWTHGVDQMWKSFTRGAATGAFSFGIAEAFQVGGIGVGKPIPLSKMVNGKPIWSAITPAQKADVTMRLLANALWDGLPETLRGATVPEQVYSYVMGAYLGYNDIDSRTWNAQKFLSKYSREQHKPTFTELDPSKNTDLKDDFNLLDKPTKSLVNTYIVENIAPKERDAMIGSIARIFPESAYKTVRNTLPEYEARLKDIINQQEAINISEDIPDSNKTMFENTMTAIHNHNIDYYNSVFRQISNEYGKVGDVGDMPWSAPEKDLIQKMFVEDIIPDQEFDYNNNNHTKALTSLRDKFTKRMPKYGTEPETDFVIDYMKDIAPWIKKNYNVDLFDAETGKANYSVEQKLRQLAQYRKDIAVTSYGIDITNNRVYRVQNDRLLSGEFFIAKFPERGEEAAYRVANQRIGTEGPTRPALVEINHGVIYDDARQRYNLIDNISKIKLNDDQQKDVMNQMLKQNYYYYGGKKDRPIWQFIQFHPELDKFDIDKLWRTADKYTNGQLKSDLKLGAKKFGYSIKEYKKVVLSNIFYDLDMNGFALTEKNITKLLQDPKIKQGKDSPHFLSSANARNKRVPLWQSSSYPLDKSIFNMKLGRGAGTKIKAIIRNVDVPEGDRGDIKSPATIYPEKNDGRHIVTKEVFDAIAETSGVAKEGNILKASMFGAENDLGALLEKSSTRVATRTEEIWMKENGVDFILTNTTAKQRGNRKMSALDFDLNKKEWILTKQGDVFDIDPSHIKVLISKNIDKHLLDNKKIAKQPLFNLQPEFFVHMDGSRFTQSEIDNTYKLIDDMYNEISVKSVVGKDEYNKALDDFILSGGKNQQLFNKIVRNFDNISIEKLVDMIKNPQVGKLTRKFLDHVTATNSEADIYDMTAKGETDLTVSKILADNGKFGHAIDRFLSLADDNVSAYLHKWINGGKLNDALTSYIVNRTVRPRIENSMEAIISDFSDEAMATYAKDLVNDDSLFYLGNRFAAKPIKSAVFAKMLKKKGNYVELGELWMNYDNLAKTPELKSKLDDIFTALVLRIPMDSVSGAQKLKFAGFTDLNDYGVLLHPRTMRALGGADSDIDSVHIYFGGDDAFKSEWKELYASQKYEFGHWDDGGEAPVVQQFSWARKANNSYEVSIRGDKRFSAVNARLKDGRTIEEAYQQAKSYDDKLIIEKVDSAIENLGMEYSVHDAFKNSGLSPELKTRFFELYGRKLADVHSKEKMEKFIKDSIKNGRLFKEDGEWVLIGAHPGAGNGIQAVRNYWNRRRMYGEKLYRNNKQKGIFGKGKKAITPNFDYWGTYKGLWEQWAKENPKLIEELREKASGKVLTDMFANTENNQARAIAEILNETVPKTTVTAKPTQKLKIVSGGQTGVDELGLIVGKKLGLRTGGTAAPRFATEKGNNPRLADYGIVEISPELQATAKTPRQFWLPRTEENAKNSDGTVYFSLSASSAGMGATRRYANKHNKPFIVNPTAEQLSNWIKKNNIVTLNVAGNRASKSTPEFLAKVSNTLETALKNVNKSESTAKTTKPSVFRMNVEERGDKFKDQLINRSEIPKNEQRNDNSINSHIDPYHRYMASKSAYTNRALLGNAVKTKSVLSTTYSEAVRSGQKEFETEFKLWDKKLGDYKEYKIVQQVVSPDDQSNPIDFFKRFSLEAIRLTSDPTEVGELISANEMFYKLHNILFRSKVYSKTGDTWKEVKQEPEIMARYYRNGIAKYYSDVDKALYGKDIANKKSFSQYQRKLMLNNASGKFGKPNTYLAKLSNVLNNIGWKTSYLDFINSEAYQGMFDKLYKDYNSTLNKVKGLLNNRVISKDGSKGLQVAPAKFVKDILDNHYNDPETIWNIITDPKSGSFLEWVDANKHILSTIDINTDKDAWINMTKEQRSFEIDKLMQAANDFVTNDINLIAQLYNIDGMMKQFGASVSRIGKLYDFIEQNVKISRKKYMDYKNQDIAITEILDKNLLNFKLKLKPQESAIVDQIMLSPFGFGQKVYQAETGLWESAGSRYSNVRSPFDLKSVSNRSMRVTLSRMDGLFREMVDMSGVGKEIKQPDLAVKEYTEAIADSNREVQDTINKRMGDSIAITVNGDRIIVAGEQYIEEMKLLDTARKLPPSEREDINNAIVELESKVKQISAINVSTLPGIYKAMMNGKDLRYTNLSDIKVFTKKLDRIVNQESPELDKWFYYMFPEDVANKLLKYFPGVKTKISPYVDKDGNIKSNTYSLELMHPIHWMQESIHSNSVRTENLSARLVSKMTDLIMPYSSATGIDFNDLYSAAVGLYEYEAYKDLPKHKRNGYEDNYKKALKVLNLIGDKKYTVQLTADTSKQLTAREIVNTIKSDVFPEMGKMSEYLTHGIPGQIDRFIVRRFLKKNDRVIDAANLWFSGNNQQNYRRSLDAGYKPYGEPLRHANGDIVYDHTKFIQESIDLQSDLTKLPNLGVGLDGRNKIMNSMLKTTYYGTPKAKILEGLTNKDTGRIKNYFPHIFNGGRTLRKHIQRQINKINRDPNLTEISKRLQKARLADKYGYSPYDLQVQSDADELLQILGMPDNVKLNAEQVSWMESNIRVDSQEQRMFHMPGWDTSHNAWKRHFSDLARRIYNVDSQMLNHHKIFEFYNKNVGKMEQELLDAHVNFYKLYAQGAMGFGIKIPDQVKNDPRMHVKGTLYDRLSDNNVAALATKIGRKLKILKTPDKTGEINTRFADELLEDMNKYEFTEADMMWLSNIEAQYQLASLLSHPKSYVTNIYGGTVNNITSAGFKNLRDSRNIKYLRKINPEWTSMEDVQKYVESLGVIEEFIRHQIGLTPGFMSGKISGFTDDVIRLIKKDPMVSDETLRSIAKKHELAESILDKAAWFMRKSERILRRDAFITHYVQAYKRWGSRLEHNHPYLRQAGLEGVKATQFLYTAPFKPMFSTTAAGKILSRFQLWAWNNVKLKRDIINDAADYGFKPGTDEFERFKRMAILDILSIGLANAFMYSIFDSALPAPWNWVQDFADWIFGDEKERDKAFFGVYPRAVAPLQMITPPAIRLIPPTITAMVNNDFSEISNYHIWAAFPFGRIGRDIMGQGNIFQNPYRIIEKTTGIPYRQMASFLTESRDKEPWVGF